MAKQISNQDTLAQYVQEHYNQDPLWSIYSFVRYWVCPFCGELGADKRSAAKFSMERQIMRHLAQKCSKYQGPQTPNLSRQQLLDRALFLEIKRKVLNFPFWKQFDCEGLWYCPYCCTATELTRPQNNKVTLEFIKAVVKHLGYCHAFKGGKGMPYSFEELKAAVKQANSAKKLRQLIVNYIQNDRRWSLKDHRNSWLCPYCKEFLSNIQVTSRANLMQNAPQQIAEHLTLRCPKYQQGYGTLLPLKELELEIEMRLAEDSQVIKLEDVDGQEAVNFRQLTEKLKKAQEMEESMLEARKRQMSMLPDLPELEGYQFGAIYSPCVHVSGDFYDFIKIDEDHLGIAQGDVTGHGVEGGIVASMTKKVLSVVAKGRTSPAEVIGMVNDEIKDDLDEKTFVSVFYGILDIPRRKLKMIRAGHNPVILYNPKRDPELQMISPSGMVIGMIKGERFLKGLQESEFSLLPGDLVVIYTDGVPEAMNKDNQEFGEERFCHYLRMNAHLELNPLFKALMGVVKNWIGGEQQDDITIVGFTVE